MKRVYQINVNAATKELHEEMLKEMMASQKNTALIDQYRKWNREMVMAEIQQTVDEMLQVITALDEYKQWLARELKKDERRKKKQIPADDMRRVKLFIKHLKSSLPAVIPTVTHFTESKDSWGRIGLWRTQANGYLSGLAVVDADHVENPEERITEWLGREDFKELGIVWIFITPSGEGIKVVFKAREEWGNLQDNAYTMAEKLGVLDFCDSQTKNSDHAHFVPKAEDVKYFDSEAFFGYANSAYEEHYGKAYRQGDSDPTQPRWQNFEKQRKEQRKKSAPAATSSTPAAATSSTPAAATSPAEASPAALSEREMAIVKALNEHYGEAVAEGRRHETFLSETAPWLLLVTDNNAQKALDMARQLRYVCNWTDQTPGELENCIAAVQKKPMLRHRPKTLVQLLAKAEVNEQPLATADGEEVDPLAVLPFDQWCNQIESFFDVYPGLREVCEPHPRRLWPFLFFLSAAMMGTCMDLTYYYFYADPYERTRLNYIVWGVGDPTSGKRSLGRLSELLLDPINKEGEIADASTNTWKESTEARGANKEKDIRPAIYNRVFGARTSNAEFIRSMINCKEEVDGEEMGRHMVTVDGEKDITMSKAGSWIARDLMVLKSFHGEYDEQHYSNKQSVSGRFQVFWNQMETFTPPTLKKLVNERNINSGLDTRTATIPMGKQDFGMLPLIRKEDSNFTEYNETLRKIAYRLDQRRGELPLWPLVEHVHKWCDDRRAIAEFNNDQADWLLIKRVPYYGINISAPYIDLRHWDEREQTGTYVIDDTDKALCDLALDIQYRTQHYWYYELHRLYYDNQLQEAAQQRRRTNKFVECFRQLPEQFTIEQFSQIFGYANNHAGQKTLQRLEADKAIKRVRRGLYKKLVSEL